MVDISAVSKYFGARPVLEGISCQIRRGETVRLVGPNGAGKSTLFKLLSGEEPVDGGTLTFARGTTVSPRRSARHLGSRFKKSGRPGGIRTHDQWIKSPLLYR